MCRGIVLGANFEKFVSIKPDEECILPNGLMRWVKLVTIFDGPHL